MEHKYIIVRKVKGEKEYKKYKCIDGWSKNPEECWKFSKGGAVKICQRYNEGAEKSPFYKARPDLKPSYYVVVVAVKEA